MPRYLDMTITDQNLIHPTLFNKVTPSINKVTNNNIKRKKTDTKDS